MVSKNTSSRDVSRTQSHHDDPPFYMREVDPDKPVLPAGEKPPPDERPEDAQYIEIGHIQTDPKISKCR